MTIYPELLTLVVRKESRIENIHDINGKRINIGNPGSGQRNIVEILFKESPALGFDKLKAAEELRAAAIDLIPIDEKHCGTVSKLLKKYPFYGKGVIPTGMYKGIDHDTPSYTGSRRLSSPALTWMTRRSPPS